MSATPSDPRLFRRAIVLVLDSVGAGWLPDAADFGDEGADTLGHIRDHVGLRVGQRAPGAVLLDLRVGSMIARPCG